MFFHFSTVSITSTAFASVTPPFLQASTTSYLHPMDFLDDFIGFAGIKILWLHFVSLIIDRVVQWRRIPFSEPNFAERTSGKTETITGAENCIIKRLKDLKSLNFEY